MKLDEVKLQLKKYRKVLKKVNQNRVDWNLTKDLIYNTLSTIRKNTKMKATIGKEEKVDGMGLVFLYFEKRESGISEKLGKVKQPLIKEGGYLFYTQIYSGKVAVLISFPTIENVVEREEPQQIDILCPRDLNEETIASHVVTFLKKMTEWEGLDINHRAIGFNNDKE
jgi:hypothetical protein